MKIILTGITGSLGSEVFYQLKRHKHQIVPVIRAQDEKEARVRLAVVLGHEACYIQDIIVTDLLKESAQMIALKADFLIHCAGSIRFNQSGINEAVTRSALAIAQSAEAKFVHVSTAYLYGSSPLSFRNQYEQDKAETERLVRAADVSSVIIRPSILVGCDDTGQINNLSGYYLVLNFFTKILKENHGPRVRFPRPQGSTNIIPINWVADFIIRALSEKSQEPLYITSPLPHDSHWLLSLSLKLLGLSDKIEFLDCSMEDYLKLNLTLAEQSLLRFSQHFLPYWSGDHIFPAARFDYDFSAIHNESFISKIITYAYQPTLVHEVRHH